MSSFPPAQHSDSAHPWYRQPAAAIWLLLAVVVSGVALLIAVAGPSSSQPNSAGAETQPGAEPTPGEVSPPPSNRRLDPGVPLTDGQWIFTPEEIVAGRTSDGAQATCVVLTVENESPQLASAPLVLFSLAGADCREFHPIMSDDAGDLLQVEVAAHHSRTGPLCFDAAPSQGTYTLVYSPITYPPTTTEWTLTL